MSNEIFPSKESILDKVTPAFFPEHQNAIYKRLEDKNTSVVVEEDPLGTRMVINLGASTPCDTWCITCCFRGRWRNYYEGCN